MTRQGVALGGVVLGAGLIGGAYALAWRHAGAPVSAAWLMAVGSALLLAGTLLLGSGRRRAPIITFCAGFLVVVIVFGFGLALLLPVESATGPLWLGLPRRIGLVITLLVLVPLLVLPVAYARDFGGEFPDQQRLDRLRDALRTAGKSPPGRSVE